MPEFAFPNVDLLRRAVVPVEDLVGRGRGNDELATGARECLAAKDALAEVALNIVGYRARLAITNGRQVFAIGVGTLAIGLGHRHIGRFCLIFAARRSVFARRFASAVGSSRRASGSIFSLLSEGAREIQQAKSTTAHLRSLRRAELWWSYRSRCRSRGLVSASYRRRASACSLLPRGAQWRSVVERWLSAGVSCSRAPRANRAC